MRSYIALLCFCALLAPGLGCKKSTKPTTYLCPLGSACPAGNTIHDLSAVYILKDTNSYRALLTSDFIFRLQINDILSGGPDTLNQSQEMAFADHFFRSGGNGDNPPADRVSLAITIQSAASDNRIGHEGWKKYSVATQMTARFPNGNDITIASPAYLYFREVPVGSGVWKLAEWIDQPASAPSREASPVSRGGARGPGGIGGRTWGQLRMAYL